MEETTNYTATKREQTLLVVDEEPLNDRLNKIETHLNTLAIGQAFIALTLLVIALSRWLA